ncbi:MAG TPA: DUF2752 domain-containing protein [bacterium]|mgnify:CR=1 FL=1|nr:DUF2752 domain-containing protein [bacterium]HPR86915.1 DUF2752 domain-containing protein [bacterium]
MKLSIRSTHFSGLETGHILLLLGLAGIAVCYLAPGAISLLPACRFQAWTSLPCPSCGATRAGMALAHGHPVEALRFNPLCTLLFLGMAIAGLNALLGLVSHRRLVLEARPDEIRLLLRTIVLALVLNWLYLLAVRFALIVPF